MLAKRIIPCLDVKNNCVVKGRSFTKFIYAGNPVELAKKYYNEGADELVFLDITATNEKRKIIKDLVEKVAKNIFIPFTVGGGINSISDIQNILKAGADKVSINTASVKNPKLISKAAKRFGSQCIVVAIDAKKRDNSWEVFINGGKKATGLDVVDWAKKVEKLGAGEILLTSIDKDGTKKGYDLDLVKKLSETLKIPIIASGGAGKVQDLADAFKFGKADAALAASIFHFNRFSIKNVKDYLESKDIEVRK